ncbi:Tautomerase/MIF superfamily [Diplogelasinospora grovesii]|uniref:L-dopachrome isomerase n=1 Tax=Diplogelasinospora grovesii TaxID=303347 RepID=A0AAN6S6K3_9PEZI|nr:Tautomerase/MIF superfamily [Diplogelasinospora grovesii]
MNQQYPSLEAADREGLGPSTPTKKSFAERKAQMVGRPAMAATTTHLVVGDHLLRDIDRALPGDVVRRTARKTQSKPDRALARKRSNFFENAFSAKDSPNVAKERVRGDAIVMADVRTNVIIPDEFTFITELSYHVSCRYQRPVSSIVVTVQHGSCMLFGGTFDPAYVMSVFGLPSELLPATNRRNTALIQKHMEEALGVPPSRGYLRFVPTKEEHIACNGKTLAAEIDEVEKASSGGNETTTATMSDSVTRTASKRLSARARLSVKSLGSFRTANATNAEYAPELTPPDSRGGEGRLPTIPASPPGTGRVHDETSAALAKPQKSAKRRKSFVATIFGRSTLKPENRPPLPSIPAKQQA